MQKISSHKKWILTPLFGSIAFVVLYSLAAFLYPGGSEFDRKASGFSWLHNYWCNLLNEKSINGETNSARAVAIAAFIVLGFTLLSFWSIYSREMQFKKNVQMLIQGSGLLCFTSLFFLTSSLHDAVINISGFFGLAAMAGVYYSLYQNRWFRLFAFGVFNLLLIATNNYIYYTKDGFLFLPVIQKVTFLAVLLWICAVDIKLYFLPRLSAD